MSKYPVSEASRLANRLDHELLSTLVDHARELACRTGRAPITVDMFIACLYQAYPQHLEKFVHQRESLEKISNEFRRERNASIANAPAPETGQMILVDLDPMLVKVLTAACVIANTTSRKASLSDFIAALANDHEAAAGLKEKWGLEFWNPKRD